MNKSGIVGLAARAFVGRGSVSAGVLLELLANDVFDALGLVRVVGVGGFGVEFQSLHRFIVLLSDHIDPIFGQRVSVMVLGLWDEQSFAVG